MKFYLAGLGNLYPNLDTIQEAIIAERAQESLSTQKYKSQVDAAAEEGADYCLTTFLRGSEMIKSVKKFFKDVIHSFQ